MATHPCFLAWKFLWAEQVGRLYVVHRTAKSLTQLNTLAIHVEGREVSGVSLYKGTNPNMSAQHS